VAAVTIWSDVNFGAMRLDLSDLSDLGDLGDFGILKNPKIRLDEKTKKRKFPKLRNEKT